MFEEYETFHDRTVKPAVGGQSISSFVPSVIKTEVLLDSDDRAHKRGTNWKVITTRQIEQNLYWCRIPDHSWSRDNTAWREDIANFSQFTHAGACREYTLPRDEEASEPKGWNRGNTKIGPVLEVATCCLHGKYGVEIWHVYEQRQFSLLGQNFSWLEQIGHEFERQRAGNLRSAVRRICVKIECGWFCKPIKGQSKTTKTRFGQLIHKNHTYWGKNLDRCWTRIIFNLWLWCVEEINSSSSSWKSTPKKMMEQLNSGELKTIFRKKSGIVIIGLTTSGRKA